ncbi:MULTISPECIES: hypothetical protein [Bacillus subtilis group]|uniref:hypothetical protein n=1 Tax=Bacillus subtilis group TaxID=653685 RepID=UPI0022831174|nr:MULTISPECIES: hypothetical protein [Bacillus subtilis group]MCY9057989.1 hypothetical protein [Bacillus inaquosorum]MEC2134666.1 hypothetical protein [Bacillus subtilis]
MSSSKFVGQLKQNNEQINNLKALLSQNEKHMTDHEQELTDKVNDFMEYQNYELKKHIENINNPHQVTKEQIGLGNVDNVQQASKAEFDEHNKDAVRHITDAERLNWNAAEKNAKAYTDEFAARRDNPNQVTKEQVGLNNVTNDKQATKIEFDAHVKDSKIHISDAERTKWNASQLSKISSDDGQPLFNVTTDVHTELLNYPNFTYFSYAGTAKNSPGPSGRGFWMCSAGKSYGHVLVMTNDNKTFRKSLANSVWTDWIEIESTEGAQKKVDAHANKTDIHVSKAEKDKWNGSQIHKLTADAGHHLVGLADKDLFTELATKRTTTFYSNNTTINQPPVSSSFRGLQIGQDGFGEVLAMGNDGSTWRVSNVDGWKTWKRLITNEDFELATWHNVTLKNGAANGDRPFQYAKWGKLLLLRGHITATREVVCGTIPSAGLPVNGATAMISVSGTTGDSKLLIFANGELKLTGIHSNNDNAVTGYYMDAVIPLE